ncbi:hypothetical protein ACFX11_025362 [Malus domestica]
MSRQTICRSQLAAASTIPVNYSAGRQFGFTTKRATKLWIPRSPNREENDWYHYHRHRRQGRAISRCEICDPGIRIRQTGMRRKMVSMCRSLCVAGHCITGASSMLTTCVIQPINMIKVRIQLGQGSAAQVTRTMIKEEGVGALSAVVHDTRWRQRCR